MPEASRIISFQKKMSASFLEHPYSYTLQEWLRHGEFAIVHSLPTKSPEENQMRVKRFFESEYPDPLEREWKYERLYLGLSYLDSHIEEFNSGRTAVVGETEALMSKNLWIAMWFVFASPESNPFVTPSSQQVLSIVEQIVKHRS